MNLLIKGTTCVALLVTGMGLGTFTRGPQDAPKKDAPKQDAAKADMGMPAPEVTPEHKWLAADAGTWKSAAKFYMPDGSVMPQPGKQVNTMQTGGLWQTINFRSDDGTFHGNGIAGYDPVKKKFISVWADSMTPFLMTGEGTLDAAKKILTIEQQGFDPTAGKVIKMRETLERKDETHVHMEMHGPGPDGKEMKMFEIDYTKM